MKTVFALLLLTAHSAGAQTPTAILEGAAVNHWVQAGLKVTDRFTDLAIQGPGFFMVETSAGLSCYTRAGRFELGPDGFLRSLDVSGDLVTIVNGRTLERLNLSSTGRWKDGVLKSMRIDLDGRIEGFYTNGLSRTLGRIALALFQNSRRLEREGGHCLQSTAASGTPYLDYAQTDGRGSIYSSSLEELSEEIYDHSLLDE